MSPCPACTAARTPQAKGESAKRSWPSSSRSSTRQGPGPAERRASGAMLSRNPSPMPTNSARSWNRRLRARPISRSEESCTAASMKTKLSPTPSSVQGRDPRPSARPAARPTTTGILASTRGCRRFATSDEAARLQKGIGKISRRERSCVSLRASPVSIGETIQKTPTAVAIIDATGSSRSGLRAARVRAPTKTAPLANAADTASTGTSSTSPASRSGVRRRPRSSIRQRRRTRPISRSTRGPPGAPRRRRA